MTADEGAHAFLALHGAIERLRERCLERAAEHRRRVHDATERGAASSAQQGAAIEAEEIAGQLAALLVEFSPTRLGVPPWSA